MSYRLILLLLVVAAAATYGLWWHPPPAVSVTRPQRGPAVAAVYATGVVEPTVMLPIAPKLAGRLLSLAVDEGDTVQAGQVLAQLEATELEQALAELRSREAYARRELTRINDLYQRQAIAARDYDNAKTTAETTRSQRQASEARLADTRLLAPATGQIIRRDGEVGQMLSTNQTLFWLATEAPLRISAEVDEEDIPQIQPGLKVLIRTDALPQRILTGQVTRITPKGDSNTRSFRVRIQFLEPHPLRIGMTVETNIILREKPAAWLVPTPALDDGGNLWAVVRGRLERRPVTVGIRGSRHTEILQGIRPDLAIVVQPAPWFTSGRKVTPQPARPD